MIAVLIAILILVLGLILFATITYQILIETEGDITDLQWWLLFASILSLIVSLLILIFSDQEANRPTGQGVVTLEEAGKVVPYPLY